jgi:hypothetical protein
LVAQRALTLDPAAELVGGQPVTPNLKPGKSEQYPIDLAGDFCSPNN